VRRAGDSADSVEGAAGEAVVAAGPLDLRLALPAAFAWLLLALCLHRSSAATATVACACAAVAMAAVAAARRIRFAGVVAMIGFCALGVLSPFLARAVDTGHSLLRQLANRDARVELIVTTTSDPHPLRTSGVGGPLRDAVTVDSVSLSSNGGRRSAPGTLVVIGPAAGLDALTPGQRLSVSGSLRPPNSTTESALLLADSVPVRIGSPPWVQRAATAVRARLRAAARRLPEQERGLLPGVVVGDTTELDPGLADRFRSAGLTHIVAVSGTNCSIVIGCVVALLRRFGVRPTILAGVGGLVLVGFVVIARPQPSVLRAAVMAAIVLIAMATGRERRALPAVAFAVLLLLGWDPALAGDPGFAMSVLATAALLVIAPRWAAGLRRWLPGAVADPLAVAAVAHLATAPVAVAISGRLSLVAVPANVLVEPVVGAATVLGFLAAVIAPLNMSAAGVVVDLAGWPCRWLVWNADFWGGLRGATVPWPAGTRGAIALAAATAGVLIICRRRAGRRAVILAGVVVGLVQVPVREVVSGAVWPPSGWIFVACDVGQGDALVLNAGGGTAVEVDAGPDPVAVDRCLSRLGVRRIGLLILTHFHLDHVAGLAGVLDGRPVSLVYSSPLAEPSSGVQLVRAALSPRHIPLATAPVGAHLTVGQVGLDVLGPAVAFRNTHSDPNNSSVVLRATVRGVRILLPGDAEIEAQHALLADRVDLAADVLKVAHHGSAYFTPAFLDAVHPSYAVISVGLHNDYGHPAPSLLTALAIRNIPVGRTDRDGDVALTYDGARLRMLRSRAAERVGAPALLPVPQNPGSAVRSTSYLDVRMVGCPHVSSRWTTSRNHFRRCFCSSATRSCSSPARSARSPPPRDGRTRR
jgi:competence protein ComEC